MDIDTDVPMADIDATPPTKPNALTNDSTENNAHIPNAEQLAHNQSSKHMTQNHLAQQASSQLNQPSLTSLSHPNPSTPATPATPADPTATTAPSSSVKSPAVTAPSPSPSSSSLPLSSAASTTTTTNTANSPTPAKVNFKEIEREINVRSLYNFAECFRLGRHIKRDIRKAIYFHKKAGEAPNNNSTSLLILGKIYHHGPIYGIKQDITKAVIFYSKSASMLNAQAQTILAQCYIDEIGGLKMDKSVVFNLLKRAIPRDCNALILLADCFKNNIILPRPSKDKPNPEVTDNPCYTDKNHNTNNENNKRTIVEKATKIMDHYKRAWTRRNPLAAVKIGDCYQEGYADCEKDPVQAFEWYKKAYSKKHSSSFVPLAKCYLNGLGTEKNCFEALKILYYAAQIDKEGCQYAMSLLGDCLYRGIDEFDGKTDDQRRISKRSRKELEKEAFKWWLKAANRNVEESIFTISNCYKNGIGVDKDYHESRAWLEKSNMLKMKESQIHLAEYYIDGIGCDSDENQLVKGWKMLNEYIMNPKHEHEYLKFKVLLIMARRYMVGNGITKDLNQANALLQQIHDYSIVHDSDEDSNKINSEVNNIIEIKKEALFLHAQILLSKKYQSQLDQETVILNQQKALEYLTSAVDSKENDIVKGHSEAAVLLGRCYKYGLGVSEVNYNKAFEYFEKANEWNDINGKRETALCILYGQGCKQDVTHGMGMLESLCNAKSEHEVDGQSLRILAEFKIQGKYCSKELSEAIQLLQKGCDMKNDTSCMCLLGVCYKEGIGVEIDRKQSFDWVKKSVDSSDGDLQTRYERKAVCLLAEFYEKGIGTDVNWSQAVTHYLTAVTNGEKHLHRLLKCFVNASNDDDDYAKSERLFLERLVSGGYQQDENIVKGQIECRLAWMLFKGMGTENRDCKRAIDILDKLLFDLETEMKRHNVGMSASDTTPKILDLVLTLLAECHLNYNTETGLFERNEAGVKKAIVYLKKALEKGCVMSKVLYSIYLITGKFEKPHSNARNDNDAKLRIDDESVRQAISLLHEAGEEGNAIANELLGDLYSRGYMLIGQKQYLSWSVANNGGDWEYAKKFFERGLAADVGSCSNLGYSGYRLGKHHLRSMGDDMKGVQLIKQAIKKGCLNAQMRMAHFLEKGLHGVQKDASQAINYYEGCVHQMESPRAHGIALWRYANLLRASGVAVGKFANDAAASRRVDELMDSSWRLGCAAAGNDLAVAMHAREKELEARRAKKLERDHERRKEREKERARKAEQRRHRNAKKEENNPADGSGSKEDGGEEDEDEDDDDDEIDEVDGDTQDAAADAANTRNPFSIFLDVASRGERRAHTNAAICLDQGLHVMKDTAAAAERYKNAITLGDPIAMNNLAVLLLEGQQNVEENRDEARRLLESAYREHGEVKALVNLGKLHQVDDIVVNKRTGTAGDNDNNHNNAASANAAQDEHSSVQQQTQETEELFQRRLNNEGNKKAFEMYTAAADLGSPEAYYNLAVCYGSQVGVQRDDEQAIKYYRKALEGGIAEASERIKAYSREVTD